MGLLGGATLLSPGCIPKKNNKTETASEPGKTLSLKYVRGNIKIIGVDSRFEREPLRNPFGFKGGYLSELWQTVSYLRSRNNNHGIGLGTQSVLWSDDLIFSSHSESGGNALMWNSKHSSIHQRSRNPVQARREDDFWRP